MDLEEMKNEVMRKIGRNVLIYQHAEHLLKFLIVHSEIEGGAGDMRQKFERRFASVRTQTLGPSVREFVEGVFCEPKENEDNELELKEATFSFKYSIEADPEYIESKRAILASIVEDRNEFVHHLLQRLKPDSTESWIDIDEELDRKQEKVLPELEELRALVRSLKEISKLAFDYLESAEGIKRVQLGFLRQSPIVDLLARAAGELARPDGWIPLDSAGRLLWQNGSELMMDMHRTYGHRTLKGLLLATDLFDVLEAPLSGGGSRVRYRVKA